MPLTRFVAASTQDLIDWTPFALREEPAGEVVDWCYLGEHRFTDPFFGETVLRGQRDPVHGMLRQVSSLAQLEELQALRPGTPPAGFIFHPGRCGSTLLAQALASLPRNIVLSEPAILVDELLFRHGPRHGTNMSDEQLILRLRTMLSALAQPRHGEKHCFVKFTARSILQLPLIRRAFPGVPCIYIYREPLEILASYLRCSTGAIPPGITHADFNGQGATPLSDMRAEEYWTRLLAGNLAAALRFHEPGETLLLNYRQLPEVIFDRLPAFFGLKLSAEDRAQIETTTLRSAKHPRQAFVPDSEQKQQAVSENLRTIMESLAMPHYQQLENLRLAEMKTPL